MEQNAPATKRPPVSHRLAVAFVLAIAAGLLTWWKMTQEPGGMAADYTWYWRAARALIDGHSPYAVIKANGPYPFDAGFNYPMTTAMTIVPIAMLDPAIGSGIVMG